MKLKAWIHCMIFLMISSYSRTASSQVWAPGKNLLMNGNYKMAEQSLTKAATASRSKKDQAESLKFLGVAQFMLSKKPQAMQTFKKALKINPALKLSDSEVADESVIPFFDQSRSPSPSSTTAAKPIEPAGSSGKNLAPNPRGKLAVAKSIKTLVKVNSNVPGAQVSIDGIAYGDVGSDLEIQPGAIVLEISAAGYNTKAVKIEVAPKTSNTVRVDLEKNVPKPRPVAKAAPSKIPLPATAGGSQRNPKKKLKGSDLFGSDKGADEFYASAPGPQGSFGSGFTPGQPDLNLQAQALTPPPSPHQPILPPTAYAAPPQYPPQPYLQQPYPQQPMYGAGPPMYQNPYSQYQQPPMYAQPPMPYIQQPPPPSVYSPYSAGYPPMQPAYDPYGGYMAPPPEPMPTVGEAPPLPPPVVDAPRKTLAPPPMKPPGNFQKTSGKKSGSSKGSNRQCSLLINLLPLGAGQFCQGNAFKGVLFAGAQVGALYFYKLNTDAATKTQASLQKLEADRATEREQTDPAEQEEFDAVTAKKSKEGNTAIDKADQNATLSLSLFAGAWAVGIIDATMFPAKSKKTIKKAKLSLLLPSPMNSHATLALINPVSMMNSSKFDSMDWHVGLSQAPETSLEYLNTSIKLGVTWEL